jgi:hypothetical protein
MSPRSSHQADMSRSWRRRPATQIVGRNVPSEKRPATSWVEPSEKPKISPSRMLAARPPRMRKRTHHQYSARRARPEIVMYFSKQVRTAS